MKKITLLVVAMLVTLATLGFSASAYELYAPNVEAYVADGEVVVDVELKDNTNGVAGMYLEVEYDDSVLEVDSIKNGICEWIPSFEQNPDEYPVKLVFLQMDLENVSGDGNLFSIKFNIKEDVEPDTVTEIEIVPDNDQCFYYEGQQMVVFELSSVVSEINLTEREVLIPATKITLDQKEVDMIVGDEITLEATIYPEESTDKVFWESSDEDVAIVDEDGNVTALTKGTAKIKATTESGKYATCTVSVGVLADAVEFTTEETLLAVEDTLTLKAKAYRQDGEIPVSTEVEYSIVEGEGVAILDGNKLEGVEPGEVTVRATAVAGTETAFADIVITVYAPITKITLAQTAATMVLGIDSLKLEYEAFPENHTDTIIWTSDDEEIVTVDQEGNVTALSAGKAKVTVTSGSGKSASCTVTVGLAADTVEITALKTNALAVGKSLTLKAKASREDGEKPLSTAVVYSIVDGDGEAEIDEEKGKLTALGTGYVTVRATAVVGTETAYDEVVINICIPATKITLNQTKASIIVGEELQLVAETFPEDNTDEVFFESSNEDVAIVDEDGYVTALAKGSAKITAMTGSGKKTTCTVTVGLAADTVEITALKTNALAVGKSLTLKAKAFREDGEKPVSTAVVYSIVGGDGEAEIDETKGKLTALGTGYVTVRATAVAGTETAYDEVVINICIPATKITLNQTKATMIVDEELQLVAETFPEDNTDEVFFESSNEDVAIVDEYGNVTALAKGSAKITAMTGSGKKTTCSITVGLAADTVEISALKATSVAVGKSLTLKAKASREDGEKPVSTAVEYSIVEGEEYAEIDPVKGKLTALEEGYVTVRATAAAGDAYDEVVIKVCKLATKVTISQTKATMNVDDELQLEIVTVLPEDNTDDIFWSSSNEDVAIVDEYGNVTAISKGSAKITAKAGSGKSATCTIKVNP